ncbi:DUF411 domain-containing protein [Haloferax sp. YSMS24]|uniref:DUF411 domain-containing protein n=1 Tax=Haloferax sp. YSMS24 TaxID=3388425 RepID=UPI00398CE335
MSSQSTRRWFFGTFGSIVLVGAAGCLGSPNTESPPFEGTLAVTEAVQYSSPGCSCCEEYATYLREFLDVELVERSPSNVAGIKEQFGVPEDLLSCHTLVLDDLVVEGHVPADVIATALERSSVSGIALAGMPAGSPGMPGEQTSPFTIYEFSRGAVGDVFIEV